MNIYKIGRINNIIIKNISFIVLIFCIFNIFIISTKLDIDIINMNEYFKQILIFVTSSVFSGIIFYKYNKIYKKLRGKYKNESIYKRR